MGKLLIIGCGGVAQVAITKCCQNSKTFSEICVASRTKSKCDALKEKATYITDQNVDDGIYNICEKMGWF
jgi:saccharopine dehydrogenase (NAD+, L-lysine-forming)